MLWSGMRLPGMKQSCLLTSAHIVSPASFDFPDLLSSCCLTLAWTNLSLSKLLYILPPSLTFVQHNCFIGHQHMSSSVSIRLTYVFPFLYFGTSLIPPAVLSDWDRRTLPGWHSQAEPFWLLCSCHLFIQHSSQYTASAFQACNLPQALLRPSATNQHGQHCLF